MHIIPPDININFLKYVKIGYLLSALMIAGSIYIFFTTGDDKYGIDFSGGHELVVEASPEENSESIRDALGRAGIENAIVQSFESGSNQYSIRLGLESGDSKTIRETVDSALKEQIGGVTIIKTDYVGPTVGDELKRNALWAMIIGLVGMLGYIAYRFEMSFALGAVASIFHDTIICFGVYLLAGYTLSMGAIAAALTIIGYSVNDTIVIFDRAREEIRKSKSYDLRGILNESINSMLERTTITSILTLFSALALFLLGGGAIADLSLFLVIGVLTGCYSTIYVACPITLWWERRRT